MFWPLKPVCGRKNRIMLFNSVVVIVKLVLVVVVPTGGFCVDDRMS